MAWYNWSQTAASNASADPTVNWAEGQAPSSVNDSARAMMASAAKYRDDVSGAIVTTGTSTAYIVASFSAFDTLAHLSGQMIAFTPHTTNGATVTLNVDSLGAKPLRTSPGVELLPGTIVQGTPYIATYNNTDGAFYLQSFFGNPYNIPLAGGLDYWGTSAPNTSFAFPIGQAISRTTYASLFSIMGTTYGVGDGTTTFNLPDKTGRISAMKEASATRLTSTYFGGNSTALGAVGGTESQTLTAAQLPANIPNTAVSAPNNTGTIGTGNTSNGGAGAGVSTTTGFQNFSSITTTVTINAAGGAAHPIVQPTIICNYILRII